MKTIFLLSLIFSVAFANDISVSVTYLSTMDNGLSSFAVGATNLLSSAVLSKVDYTISPAVGSNFIVYANNGRIGTLLPTAYGDALFMVNSATVDASKSVLVVVSYVKDGLTYSSSVTLPISSASVNLRSVESMSTNEMNARGTRYAVTQTYFPVDESADEIWFPFYFTPNVNLYSVSTAIDFSGYGANIYCHVPNTNTYGTCPMNGQKPASFACSGNGSTANYTVTFSLKYRLTSSGVFQPLDGTAMTINIKPAGSKRSSEAVQARVAQSTNVPTQISGINFSAAFAVAGVAVAGVVAAAVIAAVVVKRRATPVISA